MTALAPTGAGATAARAGLFTMVASSALGDRLLPSLAVAYLRSLDAAGVAARPQAAGWRVEGTLDGAAATIVVRTADPAKVFPALAAGAAELGASSRRQEDQETQGGPSDLRRPGVSEFIVGLDAVRIVVHPQNPLSALSVQQTERIFTGALADWSELGGAPAPIRVHRLRDQSGEVEDFSKLVMRGRPFAGTAHMHDTSNAVAAAVAADPSAIGFTNGAPLGTAKALAVSAGGPAFPPDDFHVRRQEYPLTRFVYLYTAAKAQNPHAAAFVRFALSDAGQAVVVKDAHVPVTLQKIALPNAAEAQAQARRIGRCVTLDRAMTPAAHVAHFEFASDRLDGLSVQALETALVPELKRRGVAPGGVQLIGYTDDVGDPDRERIRSHQRARTVGEVLRRAGFDPVLTGCGMENPIADNAQVAGRARNRRVEIYFAPGGTS